MLATFFFPWNLIILMSLWWCSSSKVFYLLSFGYWKLSFLVVLFLSEHSPYLSIWYTIWLFFPYPNHRNPIWDDWPLFNFLLNRNSFNRLIMMSNCWSYLGRLMIAWFGYHICWIIIRNPGFTWLLAIFLLVGCNVWYRSNPIRWAFKALPTLLLHFFRVLLPSLSDFPPRLILLSFSFVQVFSFVFWRFPPCYLWSYRGIHTVACLLMHKNLLMVRFTQKSYHSIFDLILSLGVHLRIISFQVL